MKFNVGPLRLLTSLTVISALLLTIATVSASASSANRAQSSQSQAQENPELRAALQSVVDAGASGIIALVDDGQTQSHIAVGAAELEPYRELHIDDEVRVGSITKTMVATIVLQLVDEGELSLEDTLEQWLPDTVPNGSDITLRMLLNHTSGIFSHDGDADFVSSLFAERTRDWEPQELIDIANSHPETFSPGEGSSYNNTAYVVVGLLLEKATGQQIQDLIEERIAEPLQLRHTSFATTSNMSGQYAHGYFPPAMSGDGYEDVTSWSPSWGWTSGAVVSNAADITTFMQAVFSGELFSPAMLDEMKTLDSLGANQGLGIFTQDTPCGSVWGKDGGYPGYISLALVTGDGSASVVLLMPTEPDEAINAAYGQASITAICQMLGQQGPAQPTFTG